MSRFDAWMVVLAERDYAFLQLALLAGGWVVAWLAIRRFPRLAAAYLIAGLGIFYGSLALYALTQWGRP